MLMFGGEAVADANFANIIHDIALLNSLGVKLILVHGARPQIEDRCKLQKISSQFENDIRITSAAVLECVKDAAGSLRTQIEALLTMGVANSPMHGAQIRVCSGNFVVAKPLGVINGTDFEHTGSVRRIDVEGISKQLADNSIVLLSPLGYSPTGEVFNLSLADVATQTAVALKADKLIAFGDQPGLYDYQKNFLKHCDISTANELLAYAKGINATQQLKAIINSSEQGVKRCHAVSYKEDGALLQELFTRDGAGTLIYQDDYEQLRTATIDDVGGILEIIEPLENDGTLVKRSRELLETEIDHFVVIERDGMVIACAALYPYPEKSAAEIACIVTHPDYRGENRGERLMTSIEMKAMGLQLDHLFVLTTVTAHWFQEMGFVEATLDELPAEKQSLYNFHRNSKVFKKTI